MFSALLTLVSVVPLLGLAPPMVATALTPYHDAAPADALSTVEWEILQATRERFEADGTSPPELDTAMMTACRNAAEALSASPDAAPPAEVLRAALEHAGVTDAMTYPFTLRVRDGQAPLVDLDALLRAHVLRGHVTHFGVGVAEAPAPGRDGGREHVVTLVFSRRMFSLAPFPRAARTGEPLLLWGVLPEGAPLPEVLVGAPDGTVLDANVLAGEDRTFWATVYLDRGTGRYELEVLARDGYGPQVANLFPVFVGEDAPSVPVVRLTPEDPARARPAELEERLLALLNRDRRRFGLAPLAPLGRLADAARDHSLDMARRGYFGHRGPGTARLEQRVARRGVQPALVAETIAIAPTTVLAHSDLIRSPSHRRLLLDPRMTHVGIGVVAVGRGASRRLVITEDLAQIR